MKVPQATAVGLRATQPAAQTTGNPKVTTGPELRCSVLVARSDVVAVVMPPILAIRGRQGPRAEPEMHACWITSAAGFDVGLDSGVGPALPDGGLDVVGQGVPTVDGPAAGTRTAGHPLKVMSPLTSRAWTRLVTWAVPDTTLVVDEEPWATVA